MTLCNHEEAEARIFVYVNELALESHKVVLVDTVDTNIIVIVISCFNELSQFGLEKLCIEFGVGINKRWIPIHDLISVLETKIAGLLFWYGFNSCDEVKESCQRGQLRGCLTISHLSLKNTHTTANTLMSKMKIFEFWKYSLAYFTIKQQHSKV